MSGQTPVGLGFRAGRGGSVVVAVAVEAAAPRVVLSAHLATAAEGDRVAYEPYQVAYEMPRGAAGGPSDEVVALVAEARQRQEGLAAANLRILLGQLAHAGYSPVRAGLLINRAGWMTDLLAHGLSAPEHPPVMEGLAVREALRFALAATGLATVELDEKSLPETAALRLSVPSGSLDARLKSLGATVGRPWRKEQKSACLAAWLAVAGR